MTNLNGTYIKGQELDELVTKAFNDPDFNHLMVTINNQILSKKNDLKVREAYKFDIAFEEDLIISAKQVVFLNKEKTVQIAYRESLNYDLPKTERLLAQVLVTNESNSALLSLSFDENDEIQLDTLSADYKKNEVPIIEENLPDDPDYTPHATGDLTTQAWWNKNGCLPGGYQFCGGNCGNYGDHGGGSFVNYTDRCCSLHDDCYASGITKCKCDAMLLKCVAGELTVGSIAIRGYFGPKAC